eukprot:gnl/MRDRNA2_/MRDRNA2_60421_c1_seq1.p1 gnl/MRDRNA2_/MRDRNA2_60421_c1~~gnl/MRDRNA2_/MRDRNA2_60421_c1_seq1.p1  ORF type:complete len:788 (+),score=239.08 gnl/MRDRNA2_/MRDRNA2_60421_c1_seq1:88-2451(+)
MAEAGVVAGKPGECVKVVIRCRPMSKQEEIDGREKIVTMDLKRACVILRKPGQAKGEAGKDFTFDNVYDETTLQESVYDDTGYAIVEAVMDGFNGTIFAYGQTGTGKTHTMVGKEDDPHLAGLIPRSFGHIFNNINTTPSKKFLVRASYLEIYNEEIRDLLSKNPKAKLELKDHPDGGVFVKDLTNFVVKGVDEMRSVMQAGQRNRSVASTLMNNESSRSHSIFTIIIECCEKGVDGNDHIRVGKMNLVDLAGSERQSKTGASGDTLKEATKINMSLSALGNVISALVDSKSSFVPYRDSKLTRLLQDSLGGNTKTVMCANVGPVDYNYDETLSTLRYAYRAKSIKNKPKINEDPKDAMIREFQEEIARLKSKLSEQGGGGGGGGGPRVGAARQVQGEAEVIIEKEVVEVVKEVVQTVEIEKVVEGMTEADLQAMHLDAEQKRAEIAAQAEEERRQLEEQTNIAEEERQRMLQEIAERQARREQESKQHEEMMQKLAAMEEKMLVGSEVMAKAMQQEQELKKAQIEMDSRKREEDRLKEELQNQEQDKFTLEEKYQSTEEQVQKMTAKLEKLWHRHKDAQQEIEELQKECQDEREDMLETIRELTKEVKLVSLTIDQFIPQDMYQKIADRAHWDESSDEWVIHKLELAGNRKNMKRGKGMDEMMGLNEKDASSARTLLRGPGQQDDLDHQASDYFMNERPNVYFVYTEDGGMARAEVRPPASPSKNKSSHRVKSAGRPGTASRKGRTVQQPQNTAESMYASFFGNPADEQDDAASQFPKARGLVRAM